ncbi:response regulator transcription factor [Dyella sp. LX-66]|nr:MULTISPECIES: response regulator [unclassified Dyella]MBT2117102.1 response regulator transcription factor [Dyella sp. LX-1]MBT2139822.1 response regulator transcription factor [Dyella sp. LX-66]
MRHDDFLQEGLCRNSRRIEAIVANAPLILIVEDEPDIADVLDSYLRRDGYQTQRAQDGERALQLHQQMKPDLVLLDIRMPALNGMDVLREIRRGWDTPIIMVTALADDMEKLVALHVGADDYVVKPFNPGEVVARVKAVLRRQQASVRAARPTQVGRIQIDHDAHQVSIVGDDGQAQPLMLTRTEFRLLAYMGRHPRRCFARQDLIQACLPDSDALERVIDSHLSKLRQKLQQAGAGPLIESVRGVGYRLWPES